MKKFPYLLLIIPLLVSCTSAQENIFEEASITETEEVNEAEAIPIIDTLGVTIKERFNVPEGFERIEAKEGSFGAYLGRRWSPFWLILVSVGAYLDALGPTWGSKRLPVRVRPNLGAEAMLGPSWAMLSTVGNPERL